MIEFVKGDLLADEAQALVNTVNCVGAMGRGIALQFKHAFPANYEAYAKACKQNEVRPGAMFVVNTGMLTGPKWIINFPTKRHWRNPSILGDIDSGLRALRSAILELEIESIAIPPLGSGLGGLDWKVVKPLISRHLTDLPSVSIRVYEPDTDNANSQPIHLAEQPKLTLGRAALIYLMHQYQLGLMDSAITLLEVHKLMYFLQAAGQPLQLRFTKAYYGPFAQNLRHVLLKMEGHFIRGYFDGGEDPNKEIQVLPDKLEPAHALVFSDEATRMRFDRVTELFTGFESPFGLELLSSVHWLWIEENARSREALQRQLHNWNTRKQRFTPRQIDVATDWLHTNNWIGSPHT